jgi:hypothetical protein
MQPTKKLTSILRDLLALVDDEAARNPDFATKLEAIMAELPARPARPPRLPKTDVSIPDVFAALQEKGEAEFGFWVRTLDVPTLKAVIRANGFDPAKASQRWSDPDKFVGLVVEQTMARLKRGSSFLPPKSDNQTSHNPTED